MKSVTTSRGMQYRYYVSNKLHGNPTAPALFLLHGFRDSAHCWEYMIPHLAKLPYRLVAVDTLGHGGTSKPRDSAAYAYHLMVKDIFDIADNEGIQKVIPLGHDYGSGLAQRMYNHCPHRTAAVVLLNVAYSPPNKKESFNLAAINATSKGIFGYPMFEYWNFLTAPDAAGLMNSNLDRVMEIPHANSFADMQALYGVPNAMREYLSDRSKSVELKPYVSATLQVRWRAELGEGGLEVPLCWYTAMVQQVQSESDKLVADENIKINVPLLFIGCDGDAPCRRELINLPKQAGLLSDLTEHTLFGVGHWPMYEQPQQTAEMIASFLEDKLLDTE